MSNHAEDVLFANLSDTQELEALVREGLSLEVIPTQGVRKVVQWAIDQYHLSGQTRAPSRELIYDTWGETLAQCDISLGEGYETDTMLSAMETLKSNYIHYRGQQFIKEMGIDLASVDPVDRLESLRKHATGLMRLTDTLTPKYLQTEALQAISDRILAFNFRVENDLGPQGMMFGLGMIDDYTYGIHDGELALLAAGPKVGKSWFCAFVALNNWKRGKNVALFTLENSQEMTWDRIICMLAGIPYRTFQRGQCAEHQECQCVEAIQQRVAMIQPMVAQLSESGRFHVIAPGKGDRTPQAIVNKARSLDVDVMVIDQLTFMEHPSPGRKATWEIVKDLMHDLKTLISSGNRPIPCLLAHQISREGVKAAQREGKLEMYHLAEGSEVERTADWVFGLYQTDASKADQSAIFPILAARREDLRAWMLDWTPAYGLIDVQGIYVEKKESDDDD